MIQAREFLAGLLKKRLKLLDTIRENDAEGMLEFLSKLYPDEAHFIFELLQNAEDARATEVVFDLSRECLIVQHNGNQTFTTRDAEAITNIGGSTKLGEENKIGKFGVGFKAVFSYTRAPQVFSGHFRFEIRDLLCPYPLYDIALPFTPTPGLTYFVLPFPGEKKDVASCFHETEVALRALDERALLFLNNIESITWQIEGQEAGSVRRSNRRKNVIAIRKSDGAGASDESLWLKFDSEGEAGGHPVRCSAAYALKAKIDSAPLRGDHEKLADQVEIVPVEGQAHIYFPAAKETTKLKFHVHAPFAAPVDRASVTENAENRELVAELGRLVSASLSQIKDAGLLTRSFLAVLPNQTDGITGLWRPIPDAVFKTFQTEALVPTVDGQHVLVSHAMRGDRAIRETLSAADLHFLTGKGDVQWSIGTMENRRESDFLDTLKLPKFGWKELIGAIGKHFHLWWHGTEPKTEAKEWIQSKDEKWMANLYALLDRALDDSSVHGEISQLKRAGIIRLADGTHVRGDDHPFFVPKMRLPKGLRFSCVDPAILEAATERKAEAARRFLLKAGVKEVDEEQIVRKLLATYGDNAQETPDDHLRHLKLFIDFALRSKNAAVFSNARFLRDIEGNLRKPKELFLDEPFLLTGLSCLFQFSDQGDRLNGPPTLSSPRWPLWPGYLNHFKASAFSSFAAQCSVLSKLKVETYRVVREDHHYEQLCEDWGHVRRTDSEISEDYYIPNLHCWLQSPSVETSLAIWKTMAEQGPNVCRARYRPNSSYECREAESSLIYWLKLSSWLPDGQGNFYRPADMTPESLHPAFKYDSAYGWLTKVGFGDNSQRAREQRADRAQALRACGFSNELAERLLTLPEDRRGRLLRKWAVDLEHTGEFPTQAVPDLQRRAARAGEIAAKAPRRQSEGRMREIRFTRGEIDARTALKQTYTNAAGEMFCQIFADTPFPMPFKYRSANGREEPYFEACEFLGDFEVEVAANYLALSPDCAAELKHACPLSDDEKRRRIMAIDPALPPEQLCINIETPENPLLRFTQAHLVDLQAAIRACFPGEQ